MALTLSEAKVLGLLHELGRTETVRVLAERIGLGESSTRTALRSLQTRGLVSCGTTIPTYWQITAPGASIIRRPVYREYRDHPHLTNGAGGPGYSGPVRSSL